ncbi:3-oxoacyl-[acyl-carrier protein] reductase [hydrothermal vent metagenome]|uniref:3-oxoacyl-[acyl-carrier protein] reductase n=1 Tax=hydrothermal vent metagenome TaxID=652676 RepID=A0A3B0RQP8_9ZZZZ
MTARFSGKTAIVTGGASGIGCAVVHQLSGEGCHVIVADINLDKAIEVAESLPAQSIAFELDVTSEAGWVAVMKYAKDIFGGLDILVNSAGIGFADNFEDMPLAHWNAMIAVNLTGTFLGCQKAIKLMKKTVTPAAIVNISSIAGLMGGEDIAGYSASKGGVTLLTKSVALYCAGRGYDIRCNSIHPTYVDTEMLDPVAEAFGDRQIMLDGMAAQVPLGRVAKPDDIAGAILFLCSSEAAMITGHQMVIDGGQMAGLPAQHTT